MSRRTDELCAQAIQTAERRIRDLEYKLNAFATVLSDREAELLKLKGPCNNAECRLHYAHSGPCDVKEK